MNTGAFGEGFPYSNFHDLNMDWIIKIAKDFLDQYTHIQEVISEGEQTLQGVISDGEETLQTKYQQLSDLLDEWYQTHSNDIATQLANALVDLQTALTSSISTFNTSAEAKAAETIASIPSDYTTLSNKVLQLVDNQSLNGKVRFRNNLFPTFSKNGTTITVTCPNDSVVLSYISSDTSFRIWKYESAYTTPITVPDEGLLVYNLTDSTFEVVTGTSTTLSNKKYIVCFANVIGFIVGDWEIYSQYTVIEKQLKMNYLLGNVFFRYGTRPTIVKSGTNVIVTIPDTTAVVYYPSGDNTFRIWQYKTVSTGDITVPDDSVLLFNVDDSAFVVKTGTSYTVDKNYILCLENNLGYVHGPWERYLIEQQLEELPTYYDSYINGQIGTINNNLADAPNGDSFVFISDIHVDGNANNSPALIRKIIDNTSIDKVFLNGDYIQQEHTKALALDKINSTINRYTYHNAKTFRVVGNHEYNTNGSDAEAPELDWDELYYPIIKPNENIIIRQSNGLGYIYINEAQKIKYMIGTYNKAGGMDLASIRFLLNHIADTPADYTLVFMNHGGLNPNGSYQSGFDTIVEVCDAIRNKTTWSWAYNTFDFSNVTYTVSCILVGHQHKDFYKVTDSGLPIIAITTDAYQYNEDGEVTRALHGLSEQAFDVVTINSTAKTIKLTRIGGGSSRSFTY